MEFVKNIWECFVNIMAEEPIIETYDHVSFGCFENHIDLINTEYDNICARIAKFIRESGEDPYGRKANGESLLHYALMNNVWKYDIDAIYRMFVEEKVNMTQTENTYDFILIE